MSHFRTEGGPQTESLPPRPPRPPRPPVFAALAEEPRPRRPRLTRRAELAARLLRFHSAISAILGLLLGMGGLEACSNPAEKETEATLMLFFGSTARAFAPAQAIVNRYSIIASSQSGLRKEVASEEAALTLKLEAGSWLISVEGLSETGLRLVSGSLSLALAPGERRSATIVLLPEGGTGTLSLGWSTMGSPLGSPSIRGQLRRDERAITLESPGLEGSLALSDLEAGVWVLELGLEVDGVKLAGLADSVLIVAGCDTKVLLSFSPPIASLNLVLLSPSFTAENLVLRPPLRRVALGAQARFLKPSDLSEGFWYVEGDRAGEGELLSLAMEKQGESRIDWVSLDPWQARSGSARLIVAPGAGLGPLSWEESLYRADFGSLEAMKGLDGCRSLAFDSGGGNLLLVGKDGNSLSDLDLLDGGSPLPGPVPAAEFLGPEYVAEIPGIGAYLVLSPASAELLALGRNGEGILSFLGELHSDAFASAKALQVEAGGERAWVVSEGTDSLRRVRLSAEGIPLEEEAILNPSSPGFEGMDRPTSLCISETARLLAFGSSGDDSIWICGLDAVTGNLRLEKKLAKADIGSIASLSDPVDLCFSPDGTSLYVLSYYGKALIRLDADSSGGWGATAAAKSGIAPVLGFDYPKHLALSPDGSLLLVSGGGAADGLAAFDAGTRGSLFWLGALLPNGEAGHPAKPGALAFSPDGSRLAVACPEDDSLHLFRRAAP